MEHNLIRIRCTGIWGTNTCNVTVDTASGADTRRWEYSTAYSGTIRDFVDRASSNQNQLGDTNGPNSMDPVSFSFTTEDDDVPPLVTATTPARNATNVSGSTLINITVEDKKAHPGTVSGTGLVTNSCVIETAALAGGQTYIESDTDVSVTTTTFGATFGITPRAAFQDGEQVTVTVRDCVDNAGNVMMTDVFTFTIGDTSGPYVTNVSFVDDAEIGTADSISFDILDDVDGVDLSSLVIFLNGNYYTHTGGAGNVTLQDTRISFADSLALNAANYSGDTTSISGIPQSYSIVLDPENAFAAPEAIPLIIYARDLAGNVMEREVYAAITGVTLTCGEGTIEDNGTCISDGTGTTETSSGGGGGGGSSGGSIAQRITNVQYQSLSDNALFITWDSRLADTGYVVYDTVRHDDDDDYALRSAETDNGRSHGVVLENLLTNTPYYFRVVMGSFTETVSEEFTAVIINTIPAGVVVTETFVPDTIIDEVVELPDALFDISVEPVLAGGVSFRQILPIIIVLLLIVLAIAFAVTTRSVTRKKQGPYYPRLQTQRYLTYGFVVLIVAGFLYTLFYGATPLSELIASSKNTPRLTENIEPRTVSGVIVDPIAETPIADATIRLRDHAVTTQAAGIFLFDNYTQNEAVSILHPDNVSPVEYIFDVAPDEATGTLYYNSDIVATLEQIRRDEATYNFASLYEQSDVSLVRTLSEEDFAERYPIIRDDAVQIVMMPRTHGRFGRQSIVDIDVYTNAGIVSYVFTADDDTWRLLDLPELDQATE